MSTSIADLMSSPDPLNESLEGSVVPSSRRITRSQMSRRFFSLGNTPRVQTFELDVGNDKSPQRILVTVEAEDTHKAGGRDTSNVSRRLFQSPLQNKTIRRMEKTTTTTVPLRDAEDMATTPRKRGRPARAGTPPASAARHSRPSVRKTPGRPRKSNIGEGVAPAPSSDAMTEDDQPTPRPRGRPRTSTKRKSTTPRKVSAQGGSQRKRRGRPSGQGTVLEEFAAREQTSASGIEVAVDDPPGGNNTDREGSLPVVRSPAPAPSQDGDNEMEEDIWLANMSGPPTPARGRVWSGRGGADSLDGMNQSLREGSAVSDNQIYVASGGSEVDVDDGPNDYYMDMGGPDSHSDVGSQTSEAHAPTDQDTVAAGEEFTMISIGSLPSMQPNSSVLAPFQDEELGEATSFIISQTLESLKQSRGAGPSQETRQEEEPKSTAAASRDFEPDVPRLGNASMFTRFESSQAWIRSPRHLRPQEPLGQRLARKTLEKTDDAEVSMRLSTNDSLNRQDTTAASLYEDSFSEIPAAVLEAATPRPTQHQYQARELLREENDGKDDGHGRVLSADNIQPSVEDQSIVYHSAPQSESNKLLTPPDEASPSPSFTAPNYESDHRKSSHQSPGALSPGNLPSSPAASEISPSPAERDPSRALFPRRTSTHSTETPLDQSPRNPVPGLAINQMSTLELPGPNRRPTLSPIVRAGRALQLITSDPPSPPGRESLLRSPFRGSLGNASQSPTAPVTQPMRSPTPVQSQAVQEQKPEQQAVHQHEEQPQTKQAESPWARAFPPLSKIKSLVGLATDAMSPVAAPVAPVEEDSIGSKREENRLTSLAERPTVSPVDRPTAEELREWSPSHVSSANAHVPSDEEQDMSWRADISPSHAPVDRSMPESVNPSMYAAAGSVTGRSARVADDDEEMQLGDEDVHVGIASRSDAGGESEQAGWEGSDVPGDAMRDDETDIWAIEADRPVPPVKQRVAQEPIFDPSRRGQLPSPWNRDKTHPTAPNAPRSIAGDQSRGETGEEFGIMPSMFGHGRTRKSLQNPFGSFSNVAHQDAADLDNMSSFSGKKPEPVRSGPDAAPLTVAKKPDLSAFFSSPAIGLGESKLGSSRPAGTLGVDEPEKPKLIPQAHQRPVLAHALLHDLRRRPNFGLDRSASPSRISSVPQRDFRIENRRSVDLFSPVRHNPPRQASVPTDDLAGRLSSSPSPRKPSFAHIPQKRNFTPRVHEGGLRRGESSYGDRSATSASLFSKPAPILPSTEPGDYSEVDDDDPFSDSSGSGTAEIIARPSQAPEGEGPDFMIPDLRPLPDRSMSPSKSCLRSPLKPKTPGRVVEFGSDAMSPLAQTMAREERRRSTSATVLTAKIHGGRFSGRDKENEPEDGEVGVFNEQVAKPTGPPPTIPPRNGLSHGLRVGPDTVRAPLSQTRWAKEHWVRLDELLQERRSSGQLPFQLWHQGAARKNNRGSSRSILGKQVSAQGESMVLEQWHVDVVHAFQAEIGEACAWDEKALAKRLFALLVGEERRRKGKVPKRTVSEARTLEGYGKTESVHE